MIRSQLMIELGKRLAEMRLTQADAARLLNVTQPRISDLLRGKIDRFSVDTLVVMLTMAGLEVHVYVSGGD